MTQRLVDAGQSASVAHGRSSAPPAPPLGAPPVEDPPVFSAPPPLTPPPVLSAPPPLTVPPVLSAPPPLTSPPLPNPPVTAPPVDNAPPAPGSCASTIILPPHAATIDAVRIDTRSKRLMALLRRP